MAVLKHEIWICGDGRPGCCLAGPAGDEARKLFAEDGPAKLVRTFEAGSHYDAMSKFHKYLGRERYATDHAADFEPYPEEWLQLQKGG